MKAFAYFSILFASIGSVYVAATNPGLIQQSAVLLGLTNETAVTEEEPESSQLAKFLDDYPYGEKGFQVPEPELPKVGLPEMNQPGTALPEIPPFTAEKNIELPKEKQFPVEPPSVTAKPPVTDAVIPQPVEYVNSFHSPQPGGFTTDNPSAYPIAPSPLPAPPILNDYSSFNNEEAGFATSKRTGGGEPSIENNGWRTENDAVSHTIPIQRTHLVQQSAPPQPEETVTDYHPQPSIFNSPLQVAEPSPFVADQWSNMSASPVDKTENTNIPQTIPIQQFAPPQPNETAIENHLPLSPPDPFLQNGNINQAGSGPWTMDSAVNVSNGDLRVQDSIPTVNAPAAAVPPPSEIRKPQAEQYQISPSIIAEEVPCHGTELVARVGTQVILMCDILPQLRRIGMKVMQENFEKASEEERRQITEAEKEKFVNMFVESQYPAFLQEQITVALIYNDFTANKSKEEREFFGKKFNEEFDQNEVPAMQKEFNAQSIADLKTYLKTQLGSSLERERMLWVRGKIAQQWIMYNVQNASGECTHDEMMEFYKSHIDMFTSQARVRWKELFTAFANHKTEKEAWNKTAWMGNQITSGYSFEDIARVNSEGFTATKEGYWDWTKRGSLSSQELEDALFTMDVNTLSPIIKSDKGFHIVQVVRREEASVVPFIEAQVKIREQIKMQRRKKYENDYFVELKRRYPSHILREKIDFQLK